MVTSPGPLGVGVGHEPGKKFVVNQSLHLAPERKPDQPLSSCLQPPKLSSISRGQFAPLVPMQKEQGESGQKLPGEKIKGIQCKRSARSKECVAVPVSGTAVCEDWQAATMAEVTLWEETVRRGTGQSQQLFCSETTLQNKLLSGIERKEHTSEGLKISGFQESSGSSGKKGKYSFMEIKSQIPSSEEEIESTERHDISCLPEPEVLQPRKGTCSTEMKSTDSIMILKMQIPDAKMNLGTQELLSDPKPQEEVDMPEKLDGCFLIGSKKQGTQEKGNRCLSKKAKEKWKAVEQNSTTQAVKKLKTNGNRSEDSKGKDPHYSKSPAVATLAGTQSKSFLCHPVRKKSGMQYKKRKRRIDQIKCLQSSSVTPAEEEGNVSTKCDAEHCRNALNHCNSLLCATEKNPFVRLEACNYINTFVKSSASGTTSSYKLSGFFHVAQNKRKGKKWNIGRKPRKKMKITEKSAGQNVFIDMANEHSERKNTHEAQNLSAWRKNSAKLLAFEDGFKKIPEFSVVAKGENSNSVAHRSAASGSPRALAQVHDFSNCHKSEADEKLNKVNMKLQQFTCQRAVPMTGKNVWPLESCARTSEWFHKNEMPITEEKRHLRAAFEESSDKSSVKAVGNSAVTGNLRQMDLCMSSAEINEESTHKIMAPNTECLTSLETPESSSVGIYETLSNEKVESPDNMDGHAMAFSRDDVQEVKTTLNFTTKQKGKHKGAVTKRNLSLTVQNGTSTGKKNRIKFSRKVSVGNQTFSDLKLMKVLNAGNLTKFKIPLCRNKPESRKLESDHAFERKTCSPLELLDRTSVPRRQKTGEETCLVNSEQQPLSIVSDATSTASVNKKVIEINSKDLKHDSPENLSNEMSAVPEHFSLYPHPFLEGQLESSVPDTQGTECVLKSNFPDHSWNADDHPVALEINDDSKSRGNLSQQKSQNFPDILEAYKEDVLVIDVIQNDPDLFGTSNEEELALTDCENCPVKASCTSICLKDEKQDIKPEYPVISENRDSVDDNFRHVTIQESAVPNDTENSCDWVLKAIDIKPHSSSRGSSPLGGVTEDFLEDGQLRELDELLKSYDMDEKASHSVQQILDTIELPRKYCRFYFMTLRGCERAKCWFWHVPEQGDEKICMAILRTYISIKESGLLKRAVQIFVKYYREVTPGVDFASQVLNDLLISLLENSLLREVFHILNVTVQINTLPAVDVLLKVFEHVASLNITDAVPPLISTFRKLIDAGLFLEFEHFDRIIKFLHQLQVSSQEINVVLNIKSRFQERHFEKNWLFDFNLAVAEIQIDQILIIFETATFLRSLTEKANQEAVKRKFL
ncbi:testis- and ovary-specific paz domain-containing protein 1 [Limosa lapponica baueri]|uniref:Testis-and ovary-specific paz domain-containing protein 1 n=1 Tax=Limosa lapponica baueri TaxID=1758121 RepID=A0A2I0TUB5_LIMLA|nr:testis- and ovary-specific paz domain-containing protein 1 [Limosa lapponica baueri]